MNVLEALLTDFEKALVQRQINGLGQYVAAIPLQFGIELDRHADVSSGINSRVRAQDVWNIVERSIQ